MKTVAVGSDDNYPIVEYIIRYLEDKGFNVIRVGAAKTKSYIHGLKLDLKLEN